MPIFKFIFFCLVCICCFACTPQHKYELRGEALGTTYSVSYYAKQKKNLKPAFDSIFNVINTSLSTYLKDSDISKLNDGQHVDLDMHFQHVFESSKAIFTKTDGYFDPSIGILVNAYGFGPVKTEMALTDQNIDSVMSYVGFHKFEIQENQLLNKPKHFFLDFNAIAKGYAVDILADYLDKQFLNHYFIELGGEIVSSGSNINKKQPWAFGIEKPIDQNRNRELSFAIELKDMALATSGNYRKYRTDSLTGKKFVHTINPKTGKAEKSNVLSASVVAENCMTADAYATAFMAMGFDKAKKAIKQHNISALLIYVDVDNHVQSFITEDLQEQISEF